MSFFPMNCHLCNSPLVANAFDNSNIRGRRVVSQYCPNRCFSSIGVSPVGIELLLPDEEIIQYIIAFHHKEKWFRVSSVLANNRDGETSFWAFDNEKLLISIPRFTKLSWHQSLSEQVDYLRDKMNTLILFS